MDFGGWLGGAALAGTVEGRSGITLGQFIVGILVAVFVAIIGAVGWGARDRLENENRITRIDERQGTVLSTHLPQIRAENAQVRLETRAENIQLRADLHAAEARIATLEQQMLKLALEAQEHARRDEQRFNTRQPTYRGQQIP